MRILIIGINYAPEPVGIGPYSAGMASRLAAYGHDVEFIGAKPYYPEWKTVRGYDRPGTMRSREDGVTIIRRPIYLPARPTGMKRVLHHLSFAFSILAPALAAARRRPDIVMTIAPSMMSAPVARLAARVARARSWLHIQDFEVGAAFATGLLSERSAVGRIALAFERFAYAGFDRYSSISPQMCARLAATVKSPEKIVEFRNWADIEKVRPLAGESPYRAEFGITTPYVALYSGNIANKQGIEIIVEAARLLRERRDLTFVVCGDGPNKAHLVSLCADLPNVRFFRLAPRERLGDLVGLATVHLLPQLAGAADLVLPSKLTNMLASGRPVVATADPGTGLADEVEGCGIVTPPGDASAFAAAITALIDDAGLREMQGREARLRAEQSWSQEAILARLDAELREMAGAPGKRVG